MTDQAVVERAQAGEVEAFADIYAEHRQFVFTFALRRTGSWEVAEDITQDVFVRALRKLSGFAWQGRPLRAWLVTIARNLVADHFKSGRYRLEVAYGDVLDDRQEWSDSPELAAERGELHTVLVEAFPGLTEPQREVLWHRFYAGCSVSETADVMGLQLGAAKALQYRATRHLAQLLPASYRSEVA